MLDLIYEQSLSKTAILNSAKNITKKCELQRCFFLYWNFMLNYINMRKGIFIKITYFNLNKQFFPLSKPSK